MGIYGPPWFPDLPGAIMCLGGAVAQFFVLRRFGMSKRLVWAFISCVLVTFFLLARPHGFSSRTEFQMRQVVPAAILVFNIVFFLAWVLSLLFAPVPAFNKNRRGFLRGSAIAACAIPGAVLGAGVITRKNFYVNEIDIPFPNLPADLNGLRMVQISDIHMSAFFSRFDLRRVVDACNELRGDLTFVTGDLITTAYDPLNDCLAELKRLRPGNGIWGCMGNHEAYAKCQTYTKREAHRLGIDFLRYESRLLRFGGSKLNLIGVDYQFRRNYLPGVDLMRDPEAFNLLLCHTPAVFPEVVEKGMDLMLSGHTHGGQINLEVAGTNFNLVDMTTPYTKGLYRKGSAAVYVNSGLGTIGIPVRIGAPPEITVIRLCRS